MDFLTDLLPHQEAAINKLKGITAGALFMDMGTGKTRTGLELIKRRLEKGYVDRVLWLCPCSVIENLKQDMIRHCNEIPEEIKIAGIESISASGRLYLELLEYVGADKKCYLIVDESSLVKNPTAKRSQRIEVMADKCVHKLILNGTPVSRNEADLYEQFKILDWEILGYKSYYTFAANHIEFKEVKNSYGNKVKTDQVARVLNTDYLSKKIAPYTYQVKKEECFELPEKHYIWRSCDMTGDQWWAYQEAKDEFLIMVDEMRSETIYRVFTALQHVTSGRKVRDERGHMVTEDLFEDWHDNPRLERLRDVIRDDIKYEKCIIFAKYQREVEEIEALLDEEGLTWAEFTGEVKLKDRNKALEGFRGDTQYLIANKTCGAFGLNLQHCHNMIFYSNDFNYGSRLQAEDRIHRLGQTEECYIYDIVMDNSIDCFIKENLGKKGGLLAAFKKELEKRKKEEEQKGLNEKQEHDKMKSGKERSPVYEK